MKIKPFKLALLAAVFAPIVMIAWFFVPIIFFVVMNPLECDEGPDKDHASANVRAIVSWNILGLARASEHLSITPLFCSFVATKT
jgi:hypothetical protein